MTDLTPDHPAVKALATAIYRALSGQYGDFGTPSKEEAHAALTAALLHLTADNLRNTPAGRALMAETLRQAGKDMLHGDPSREAESKWLHIRATRLEMELGNPYREPAESAPSPTSRRRART